MVPMVTVLLLSIALGSSLKALGTGDFIASIAAGLSPALHRAGHHVHRRGYYQFHDRNQLGHLWHSGADCHAAGPGARHSAFARIWLRFWAAASSVTIARRSQIPP